MIMTRLSANEECEVVSCDGMVSTFFSMALGESLNSLMHAIWVLLDHQGTLLTCRAR